ncbi:MAG: acylphosphatase [Candidatus Omnitrophica bacterium]|nr:acylphosphatase [Candidatus Omnitrophota bacterium]
MNVRANIFYIGIVQGVGFRYTTQHFSMDLGLTGWVKNLTDGRVEIMVEGEKSKIIALMEKLENHFSGSIQDKDINYLSGIGTFKDFRVI